MTTEREKPMNDFPNARDCEHGRLRRKCEICELNEIVKEKDAKIAEQARELSLCREWRDAVQGIAVDAGVVITGDPIEDVRLAIEFRDTAIAEQAEEIERLRGEE